MKNDFNLFFERKTADELTILRTFGNGASHLLSILYHYIAFG